MAIDTILRRHGFTFSFTAPAAGNLGIVWPAIAQHGAVTIAKATASVSPARTITVTVRFTAQKVRDLKCDILAKTSFTPSGSAALSETANVTL